MLDWIRGSRCPRVNSCCRERGQFATGGKSHDPDALRIKSPLQGAAAHQTDRTLDIGQRTSFDSVGRARFPRQAILQHESRHAVVAQPFRDVVAFVVHPEFAMSAARRDNNRRSGGFVFGRKIRRNRRMVDAGYDVLAISFTRTTSSGILPAEFFLSEPGAPSGHKRMV